MDPVWLLLLLPLAAVGGWLMAIYDRRSAANVQELPDAYFKGLSFLLNEEPDKALKVFLEVVEVDKETVEMHMALGNLFRRRGEIERATLIHQNLVARSNLDGGLRCLALFELAQDYFKAGLYDRAENLFLELGQSDDYRNQANKFLLQIYDQEKEWKKAISVAETISGTEGDEYARTIAHFHCELAELEISAGNNSAAEAYLESAFRKDAKCIRAVIQSGRLASMRGNHTNAIAIWRGLEFWAPAALGEVVGHITNSYISLNDKRSLKKFLQSAIEINPDPRIIAMLVELTEREKGGLEGERLLLSLVQKYPSLENLYQLVNSKTRSSSVGGEDNDFTLLAGLLSGLVESGRHYNCRKCGFQSNSLHWQCPGCKGWGTVQRQSSPRITAPAN
jgi:lipopolysaccharide biosynthesis regulator YciM